MKRTTTPASKGGEISVLPYEAPHVEALDVAAEKGFASSGQTTWDYDPIVKDEYDMDDIYGSY